MLEEVAEHDKIQAEFAWLQYWIEEGHPLLNTRLKQPLPRARPRPSKNVPIEARDRMDLGAGLGSPIAVAALHGVTVQAVTQACREGRLKAQHIAGRWLIARADAEAWSPRGLLKRNDISPSLPPTLCHGGGNMADREREWLTAKEVATMKGISVQAVTAAMREGRLPSQGRLIHRDDADKWEPRKPKK